MSTEIKIVALTSEKEDIEPLSIDKSLYTFGGKMAGVCYMPDDYFDQKIQNVAAANRRAKLTSESGHHSVFDHGYLTFQISGIPKIMGMILNSTEQYTTSEKSARYTLMKPETDLEAEVYAKWVEIFNREIKKEYENLDDKTVNKLALENARYMISVFTPTSMMWTTSYRQIAYIIAWLEDLGNKCIKLDGEFNRRLSHSCMDLSCKFKDIINGYHYIKDTKHRSIEFLHYQNTSEHINNKEYIGDVYQLVYLASFAQLAQLHRHRTIHYEMDFSGTVADEYGVYIPKIIRNTEIESEWLEDFKRVSYCYPQGTLVKVLEQGRAIKFFDKCKERLCGRAQLEIMENSKDNLQKFISNKSKLSSYALNQLMNITDSGKIVTKCGMAGMVCNEKCAWGSKYGLDRQI